MRIFCGLRFLATHGPAAAAAAAAAAAGAAAAVVAAVAAVFFYVASCHIYAPYQLLIPH